MPKSNSVRAQPKAALRPAVASGCWPKSSATADLQVPNRKQRRASTSASIGDQGDQELAARRSAPARQPIKSPITQPEMPERTHATATPRPAVSIGSRRTVPIAARRRRRIETAGRGRRPRAHEETRRKGKRGSLSEQIQGAVALGRCQNPTACEHIRRLPCGQLLRAAVAEELRHRRSPSPKQKTAAGLDVGQHRRPGRPGLAARRSATARQPIKSPITQPEMPEHTHATATPRPAVSIGSRRTVPIAARRRRRIETAGRGAPPSRARGNAPQRKTRLPFRADSRSGRARPMPKSNSVRAHPKAALRPAVASGCWRRAPPPPISKSQTENSGGPRRRPASATRATRNWPRAVRRPHANRSRARSPSLKCQSTHTPQPPLGQRFRSARAEQSP